MPQLPIGVRRDFLLKHNLSGRPHMRTLAMIMIAEGYPANNVQIHYLQVNLLVSAFHTSARQISQLISIIRPCQFYTNLDTYSCLQAAENA